MRKKLFSGILSICLLVTMLPAMAFAADEESPFIDVTETAWYYNSVQYAFENGLMSGTSETTFAPNGTLTREMFVTILGRYAKIDTSKYNAINFSDVEAGKWYTPYIDWAYRKGITSGIGEDFFGVGTPVTREQMAALITNYLDKESIELPEIEDPIESFKDEDAVSSWAKSGLEMMRKTGLIAGDDKGNFNPQGQATRAMAAAIFERMVKAVNSRHINGFDNVGEVGSTFTFGRYEQDNDLQNGKEPIEWEVLDIQNGKALLISTCALDARKYNDKYADVTWADSTLRTWLNNDFMYSAFSNSEISKIATTTVSAEANPSYASADPGKDTHDKVFLLSINECKKYYRVNAARICFPTDYAVAQGVYQSSDKETCFWWLRNPGSSNTSAAYVTTTGRADQTDLVNSLSNGVRPAVWININDVASMHDIDSIGDVGTTFKFGSYEQDNDETNGKEDIQWIVLARDDDRALVISKYVLYPDSYDLNSTTKDWEGSSVRENLNTAFLNEAFDETAQKRILTTTVKADANPDHSTEQGQDTEDKIFLLSSAEAKKYFAKDGDRKCAVTEYADSHGVWTAEDLKEDGFNDREENKYAGFWWTRSNGDSNDSAALVFCDGSILNQGIEKNYYVIGVRPAMWVSLK